MKSLWFDHLAILPIIVPLLGAALTLVVDTARQTALRAIVWMVLMLLIAVAITAVMRTSAGEQPVYLVGNWKAPFGIVLVVDKLAAIMLVLVAAVGAAAFAATTAAAQRAPDRHFHALLLLQLMGLNGAFLTGDLFNLFVFFEVLLAASYGMLLQHADRRRTNAATHYVVINLVGSALFLIAASLMYGVTGTLNMADLSQKLSAAPPFSRTLVAVSGGVLVVVFAIKAALLPLNFWLTRTYSAALLPVAALFALMTKVGVIAVIRMLTMLFPQDTPLNGLLSQLLLWLGPLTLIFAALGALTARELTVLIGWSVVGSAGLMVTGLAVGDAKALSGVLFYLMGTTLAAAFMFLNAGRIDATRAAVSEKAAPTQRGWGMTGIVFLIGAAVLAGVPPFSGFIGKATLLSGSIAHAAHAWVFAAVLGAGLLVLLAYARMGSRLFLKRDAIVAAPVAVVPILFLTVSAVALTVFAAPIQRFTDQAAIELKRPAMTSAGVLSEVPTAKLQEAAK